MASQYDVKVGENEHGQALANGLLAAQVGAATKLRNAGFRQRMTHRLAVGLAGPFCGAHERHVYCLRPTSLGTRTRSSISSLQRREGPKEAFRSNDRPPQHGSMSG